jgi:hypothetical protein
MAIASGNASARMGAWLRRVHGRAAGGVTQPVWMCDTQVTQTELRESIDTLTRVTDVTMVTQNSRLLLLACTPSKLHQEILRRGVPGRLPMLIVR